MSTDGSYSESELESVDLPEDINPRPTKRRRRSLESLDEDTSIESDTPQTPGSTSAERLNGTFDAPSRIQNRFQGNFISHTVADISRLKSSSVVAQPNKSVTSESFESIALAPWLQHTLRTLSIDHPTPIQFSTIPPILAGSDVLASSPTGTGKTLAFALPILHTWSIEPFGIYALILTPTRELALQIYEQFSALGSPSELRVALITGGSEMRPQALALERSPHVVVATPGRLADHIRQSGEDTVRGLKRVKVVVLDEADRLLDNKANMVDDLGTCLGALPARERRQTLCYTATMTEEVRALRNMTTSNGKKVFVCELTPEDVAASSKPPEDLPVIADSPTEFSVDSKPAISNGSTETITNTTALTPATNAHIKPLIPPTIRQTYLPTPSPQKAAYLHVLLSTPHLSSLQTIIFTNRTSTTDLLHRILLSLSHRATSLHSSLPQSQRNRNLADFRARKARILVATDVAGRGLDIRGVELVVNYDVPRDPGDYVHRVGRTGRLDPTTADGRAATSKGRTATTGTSITLVGARDVELILAIEAYVGVKVEEYVEEGVNVETRVVKDGGRVLRDVGVARMEALRMVEGGRDVKGRVGKIRKAR